MLGNRHGGKILKGKSDKFEGTGGIDNFLLSSACQLC